MSLIQARMSIRRNLLWARFVTFGGALYAVGGFVSYFLQPDRVGFWSVGSTVYFAAMSIVGVVLWIRARKRLTAFEAENGKDAGRQVPVTRSDR